MVNTWMVEWVCITYTILHHGQKHGQVLHIDSSHAWHMVLDPWAEHKWDPKRKIKGVGSLIWMKTMAKLGGIISKYA